MNHNYCIIMAGGAGTRLWPISRNRRPKQFLEVGSTGKSFIRHTYERFCSIVPQENILVVTTEKYRDLVMADIPELSRENLLVEPYGRNTAPCVAYATYTMLRRDPEAAMIVTPSDHMVVDAETFKSTILSALDYARTNEVLMTVGITPTRPDSNYGYIQVTGGRNALKSNEAIKVKTFTEKPDKELAKIFIDTGEFVWNSGIFVWKAQTIRQEMERYAPEITKLFAGWERVLGSAVEEAFINRAYADCINLSIDYAVMEKTERAWVYPASFRWADIGTWESLYEYGKECDPQEKVVTPVKVLLEDCSGNFINSNRKDKLIAIKGLENYVVVDTDDVLVVCPKDDKIFKNFISGIAMPEYEKYR